MVANLDYRKKKDVRLNKNDTFGKNALYLSLLEHVLAKTGLGRRCSGRVKDLPRWMLLVGVWLGSLLCGLGQIIEYPTHDDLLEQAPESGVLDRAGLGNRSPGLIEKLKADSQQLKEDHGIHFYVVIESVMVSGNPQNIASRYRRNWVPNGDGVVVVFETDTRGIGVGQGLEQEADPMKAPKGQVPSYETAQILRKAAESVDRSSPEKMVESFTTSVVDGYNDYFRRKNAPISREGSLKVGMIIIGVAAALALVGLMAALLVRRSDNKGGGRCFYLPDVEVPERLGAPYGGGEVSFRRFGKGGQERP